MGRKGTYGFMGIDVESDDLFTGGHDSDPHLVINRLLSLLSLVSL